MSIPFTPANFGPTMLGYTGQQPFRFWCQKVLPLVYDDSLSYYELLNKVVDYLNNTISDVANVETNVDSLNTSFGSLQDFVNDKVGEAIETYNTLESFVNDYFTNLDVQEEINTKLDEMVVDGTLSELILATGVIDDSVPAAVSQWLNDNLTPTTPPVDATLTISDAAADAKITGQRLEYIEDWVSIEQDAVYVTDTLNTTANGVTIQYVSNNQIKIYGQPSASRRYVPFNGVASWKTTTGAFVKILDPGMYKIETSVSGFSSYYRFDDTYSTFSIGNIHNLIGPNLPSRYYTFTGPVMIGLALGQRDDEDYGTQENPTIITINIYKLETKNGNCVYPVDSDTGADEANKTDMAPIITEMLSKKGVCNLAPGIYYVSGIDMPASSRLNGCGVASEIRLLQSAGQATAIKMHEYNQLTNLLVTGDYAAPTRPTDGGRNGIAFIGNWDGEEGADQYETKSCQIDNVFVWRFSGSGIKCHNTSKLYRNGIYVCNSYISTCWAGINIDYVSEFNKFVNVCTAYTTIGCINNGGNNVFSSCTFYGTSIGFYIDGTKENSGHGTINGCTFCHSGSSAGSGITIENCNNGFVISNSQVWYNSIDIDDSSGIVFSGCEFGRGTTGNGATINIDGGNTVMFVGCVFMNDSTYPPDITITNNTKVKFNGCYGGTSGNEISG